METFTISNRRYLGNKFRLLPFIRAVADRECVGVQSVFDAFAGTGSVSSAFTSKRLVVNDLMYSNYLSALTWFSPEAADMVKVTRLLAAYNDAKAATDGYMSQHFADTYFSRRVCRRIDFVRDDIEARWLSGELNLRERAMLVTSLLYAMDRIAATCGHYDAFRRHADLAQELLLRAPEVPEHLNPGNICLNADAGVIAPDVECDLVYLDPPYNSRQYCDAYHLLENVARWQKPEVTGVARKMDRTALKSRYCTASAAAELADLVDKLRCRYIMLSYNNAATALNGRSNAKISDAEITAALSQRGPVAVFSTTFRPFSAGKGKHAGNEERLFLCTVK